MSRESIRTFIALEISEEIKEKIIDIQNKIKQTNSLKGKWVSKDKLHLTLKFLGDTQLKYVEKIKDKIKECFKDADVINCHLTNIGTFPNEKFPRVIWAGIKSGDIQIINLAKKLEESLLEFGFKKEKRGFKTHITICRPKQILNRDQFKSALEEINKNFRPREFTINKIIFFESKLTPQGPIYTALLNYFLQ
ncbi:MAG: RNA 2',3'-cyclic phosphodiesterase [Candidatus Omnitrophica bacterium]|nr:RNA 2',3'-cyclic phosphodiesterase [Candidatus Omnitrophota bacterium]